METKAQKRKVAKQQKRKERLQQRRIKEQGRIVASRKKTNVVPLMRQQGRPGRLVHVPTSIQVKSSEALDRVLITVCTTEKPDTPICVTQLEPCNAVTLGRDLLLEGDSGLLGLCDEPVRDYVRKEEGGAGMAGEALVTTGSKVLCMSEGSVKVPEDGTTFRLGDEFFYMIPADVDLETQVRETFGVNFRPLMSSYPEPEGKKIVLALAGYMQVPSVGKMIHAFYRYPGTYGWWKLGMLDKRKLPAGFFTANRVLEHQRRETVQTALEAFRSHREETDALFDGRAA